MRTIAAPGASLSIIVAGALLVLSQEATAQPCLGRPVDSGEHAVGARIDMDRAIVLAGEYSGASGRLAWSGFVGGAAEGHSTQGFVPAFGAGMAYTGIHRAICPAFDIWTHRPAEGAGFASGPGSITFSEFRWTEARLGLGLGRRFGEDRRVRALAFVFPHARWFVRDVDAGGDRFDDTRREWWLEAGFSLRGERVWGRAAIGIQVADKFPGEDVVDSAFGFATGVAF